MYVKGFTKYLDDILSPLQRENAWTEDVQIRYGFAYKYIRKNIKVI